VAPQAAGRIALPARFGNEGLLTIWHSSILQWIGKIYWWGSDPAAPATMLTRSWLPSLPTGFWANQIGKPPRSYPTRSDIPMLSIARALPGFCRGRM